MSNPLIVFELPLLYGECQTGKTKVYKVEVHDNHDGSFSIYRHHGQLGGKMQADEKRVETGKNLGKASATSPREQAIMEAMSMHQKKLDANYSVTQPVAGVATEKANLLPMLAQSYSDSGHRMIFPCYAQRKLNGVRCLARRDGNTIWFTSRKNKPYDSTLSHLVSPLLKVMSDGEIFDGEIYIHGLSLQTIVSYVKKLRPGLSEKLQYWIYDVVDSTKTFEQRYARYSEALLDCSPELVSVPCVEVQEPDTIQVAHDEFVQAGYEGAILRNKLGLYKTDHRSADLQKFKRFKDEEFLIIGGNSPTTGRYSGGCVFQCQTKDGKIFDVAPRGTVAIRQQYFKDLPQLIGKQLTVRFFAFSDAGIPLFPVGICPRDYEA